MDSHHGSHRVILRDTCGGKHTLLKLMIDPQSWIRHATDGYPLFAKSHVERIDDPDDECSCKGVKRHESRVDRPFGLADTGIEDDETWNALERDESRCCQLREEVVG